MRHAVIACAALLCACGDDAGQGGLVLEHDFPAVRAAAGEDLTTMCLSWRLGNDEPLWVHDVAMEAGPGWHHSNWFHVPEGFYSVDDGAWECGGEFDDIAAGLAGGVLFAQSTQSTVETQSFGEGAALEVPPHSVVVGQIHIINATDAPLDASLRFTLRGLAPDEVVTELRPLALEFRPLAIPAGRSRFRADCDLEARYDAPLDFAVHYVLPHYHALGRAMTLETYGGTRDGDTIFERAATIGEPLGETMSPPRPVDGAQGLRFSCEYDNTTGATVTYGNRADGEMCILLAFTDAPVLWGGGVLEGAPVSLGPDEDGVEEYGGDCDVYWVAR